MSASDCIAWPPKGEAMSRPLSSLGGKSVSDVLTRRQAGLKAPPTRHAGKGSAVHAPASIEKPSSSEAPAQAKAAAAPPRNMAVDAYRGLVMLLMMGEVMNFSAVFR